MALSGALSLLYRKYRVSYRVKRPSGEDLYQHTGRREAEKMKRMKLIKNRGIASVTAFSLALALTVTSVLGSSLGTLTVRAAGGTLSMVPEQ